MESKGWWRGRKGKDNVRDRKWKESSGGWWEEWRKGKDNEILKKRWNRGRKESRKNVWKGRKDKRE